MEVMGLMLGEFIDDYTVRVVDVFAMPQSGTGVSVEAVDPVFQTKMLDMLKQTGRWVVSREGVSAARAIVKSCIFILLLDLRWLSDGTIHTQALAAGFLASTSTLKT